MTICTVCASEFQKEYKLVNDKIPIKLANLPESFLRKINDESLDRIIKIAQLRSSVCKDCTSACNRQATRECLNFNSTVVGNKSKTNVYANHIISIDKKLIEDVKKEQVRRQNIRKVQGAINPSAIAFPSVPTHAPS